MTQAVSHPELAEQIVPPARDSILLVEDDPSSRHAMTALLSSVGYEIHAVESAEEALGVLAAEEPPAIAIVDLNLPGMDGLELIAHLKRMNPEIHAVLTTAYDSGALQSDVRRLGVGYLRKPISFDKLLCVLRT